MKNKKEIILSQFESDLAIKLLEFGETISKIDCDVVVLMSRKFCCLYDILIQIGSTIIDKEIVSDKMLDCNTDIFKNKKVAIIDDIVICGTSIWKAKSKLLENFQAREVTTYVFCTNEKYWVPECIDPDYKAIVLSDERSLTFCASIVSALSIAPRPYAVDFPLFHNLEIKEKYWQLFISSQTWNVYDITSSMQERNNVSSLSFFPTNTVLDDFKTSLGQSFYEMIEISKIRIYSERIKWGFRISIMPIVTLRPISNKDLNTIVAKLFNELIERGFDEESIDLLRNQQKSVNSKLRLIQYISSILLFKIFRNEIEKVLDKTIVFDIRQFDIDLLFGRANCRLIKNITEHLLTVDVKDFLNSDFLEKADILLSSTEYEDLFDDGQLNKSVQVENDEYRNVFTDFSNIFLNLYKYKEIPSRAKVREYAPKKQWDNIRKIDRLETGITWIGILQFLKKTYKYKLTDEVKNVMSLILDYSIDKGICVPVIRYNKKANLIYRAYRHGEDVKFAEQETELCGHVIENSILSSSMNSLPKLHLEKLMVLFIRIGASQGIFQLQYGTNGQDGIAKIGFHLHGAVVKMKKRNNFNAESNLWLSRHLIEKEVIKKAGDNNYLFDKHFPAIQISTSSVPESKKFGAIMGMLFKGFEEDQKKTKIDEDDLIFLSTCFRPRDVAAALYVEHDIFLDRLNSKVSRVLNLLENKKTVPPEIEKELLQNDGYTALNSIHKKVRGWKTSGAENAIEKGKNILERLGQFTAKFDWESYWESLSILRREDEEEIFGEHIDQMSLIGHRLLLHINFLSILLLLVNDEETSKRKTKLRKVISKIKAFESRTVKVDESLLSSNDKKLINNLELHYDDDFQKFEVQSTAKYIRKTIDSLNYQMSKTLGTVSIELEKFEQQGDGTINYDHVMYYDIVDSTATKKMQTHQDVENYRDLIRRTKLSINDFVTSMQKDAQKNREDMYCWNGNATSTNDAKFVFLSSRKIGFSQRRIKEFIDRLYSHSNNEIAFRMIVSPTNVFYSNVFKRFRSTEVEGEHFWEHYSRVHKKFKNLENTYNNYKNLILFIGNNNEIEMNTNNISTLSEKLWQGEIETVIAAGHFKTFGELWAINK